MGTARTPERFTGTAPDHRWCVPDKACHPPPSSRSNRPDKPHGHLVVGDGAPRAQDRPQSCHPARHAAPAPQAIDPAQQAKLQHPRPAARLHATATENREARKKPQAKAEMRETWRRQQPSSRTKLSGTQQALPRTPSTQQARRMPCATKKSTDRCKAGPSTKTGRSTPHRDTHATPVRSNARFGCSGATGKTRGNTSSAPTKHPERCDHFTNRVTQVARPVRRG